MHHLSGEGDFDRLLGTGPWPMRPCDDPSHQAFVVGLLLLVAAAGKSALVPFSGWLPRAMEGPTPSSAVFYGALSVHLGAFLLLRVSPLLEQSPGSPAHRRRAGADHRRFAYLAGSVQTDIKSALSYASLSQVGIIVAEIGLGFRYVALVHLLGHACLRTLQFLRAPTLLHDYHTLENAIGDALPQAGVPWVRLATGAPPDWLYRLALEQRLPRHACWSNTWSGRSSGRSGGATAWSAAGPISSRAEPSRESDQVKPHFGTIEEFS